MDSRYFFPSQREGIEGWAIDINLGDCFAYALAVTENLPLLTLDSDFRAVDIPVILPPGE